jgi:AraC-like DNA-binding protein
MREEVEVLVAGAASLTVRRSAAAWDLDPGAREHASIHVVIAGSFSMTCGDAFRLEPDDVVFIRPVGVRVDAARLDVRFVPLEAEAGELVSATYASPVEAISWPVTRVVHVRSEDVRRDPELSSLLELLRGALLVPPPLRDRLAGSLLAPLLAYVATRHERSGGAANDGPTATPLDARVARALQLMRSMPAARWTIAALAKAAGASRATLARRVLAETGMSPLRWLAGHRMHLAARLLVDGDESLAAIAARIGYQAEFAFSRAFKRHTGLAPGAFRRRARAATIGRQRRTRAVA